MTTSTVDLATLDRDALAQKLRELPVGEWNAGVRAARKKLPGWRANLSGANLSGADLSEADLYGASLYGADLSEASLSRAGLSRANLYGAYLSRANILDADGALHTLTGRHAWIGQAAGYPVLMLATDHEAGHVLRAGCWTGLLDDAVGRAAEEGDSPIVRVEAEAVVAHGRALLAAWKEDTDA